MGADRICALCISRFATPVPRCLHCALSLPSAVLRCEACDANALPFPFVRAVAACDYRFPWDGVIDAFKAHQALDLTGALSRLLVHALRTDGAGTTRPACDIVVPMPAGPARLRSRGFNPAWELARRVARQMQKPASPHLLARVFDATPQRSLSRSERMMNVQGTMHVAADAARHVHHRRVALVDDVMTTGASTIEATRALLEAGAHEVEVWLLARTPAPGSASTT